MSLSYSHYNLEPENTLSNNVASADREPQLATKF